MSRELILKELERRERVFSRLWEYLAAIKEAVRELDPDAEVYLFGSVARGETRPDSDVDVLVVSDRYGDEVGRVAEVLLRIEERLGFVGVFEVHVVSRRTFEERRRLFGVLVKV